MIEIIDVIGGRDFGLGENKKESPVFGGLKVDWSWSGLIIKVSAKKFHEFLKLLLIKLGFYTNRVFIVWSLFNAIMFVL